MNTFVKSEIQNADFFSIEIDAVNQTSQSSLIVRFVNSEGLLVQRFLGFHNLTVNSLPETLVYVLDEIFQEFDYSSKLKGQCYDGASVTSIHNLGKI